MNGAVKGQSLADPLRRARFTRQHKLTKPIDFKRVFNNPMVSSDTCFKVLATANGRENARLGMAVSRQVDKRAVGRNRIKRAVRESFRLYWAGRKAGLDVVVLPRWQTATMCNEKLLRSLSRHWSKLESQFEG
jgi:ribonuclease P protein component